TASASGSSAPADCRSSRHAYDTVSSRETGCILFLDCVTRKTATKRGRLTVHEVRGRSAQLASPPLTTHSTNRVLGQARFEQPTRLVPVRASGDPLSTGTDHRAVVRYTLDARIN